MYFFEEYCENSCCSEKVSSPSVTSASPSRKSIPDDSLTFSFGAIGFTLYSRSFSAPMSSYLFRSDGSACSRKGPAVSSGITNKLFSQNTLFCACLSGANFIISFFNAAASASKGRRDRWRTRIFLSMPTVATMLMSNCSTKSIGSPFTFSTSRRKRVLSALIFSNDNANVGVISPSRMSMS